MYQLGDTVPLAVTVTDAAQAPADSTDIALAILKPDGTTTTVAHGSLIHGSTGQYSYPYVPADPGRYVARWTSTSPQASYEETFDIAAAFGAVGLVSLAEVKAALNIPATNTTSDDELEAYIVAASAWLEDQAGPVITAERTDRILTTARRPMVLLPGWPVLAVSSVVNNADGTTVAPGDYWLTDAGQLALTSGAAVGTVWPADVTVTYTTGQTDTSLLRGIVLELIEHWWQGSQQGGSLGGEIVTGDTYDQPGVGQPDIPARVGLLLQAVQRGPRVL